MSDTATTLLTRMRDACAGAADMEGNTPASRAWALASEHLTTALRFIAEAEGSGPSLDDAMDVLAEVEATEDRHEEQPVRWSEECDADPAAMAYIDPEEGVAFTLDEFLECNEQLGEEDIARIKALAVGATETFNEGAGGVWSIQRVR